MGNVPGKHEAIDVQLNTSADEAIDVTNVVIYDVEDTLLNLKVTSNREHDELKARNCVINSEFKAVTLLETTSQPANEMTTPLAPSSDHPVGDTELGHTMSVCGGDTPNMCSGDTASVYGDHITSVCGDDASGMCDDHTTSAFENSLTCSDVPDMSFSQSLMVLSEDCNRLLVDVPSNLMVDECHQQTPLIGIQLDEDLNPESLPFESLNSNFQYAVLLDSDSDEDSSTTNPAQGHDIGSIKRRLDLSEIGDALDLLSTEAENQLEGCDKWSLGSCSLGGFDSRTWDKRRSSIDHKEEMGKLLYPERIPESFVDECSTSVPPGIDAVREQSIHHITDIPASILPGNYDNLPVLSDAVPHSIAAAEAEEAAAANRCCDDSSHAEAHSLRHADSADLLAEVCSITLVDDSSHAASSQDMGGECYSSQVIHNAMEILPSGENERFAAADEEKQENNVVVVDSFSGGISDMTPDVNGCNISTVCTPCSTITDVANQDTHSDNLDPHVASIVPHIANVEPHVDKIIPHVNNKDSNSANKDPHAANKDLNVRPPSVHVTGALFFPPPIDEEDEESEAPVKDQDVGFGEGLDPASDEKVQLRPKEAAEKLQVERRAGNRNSKPDLSLKPESKSYFGKSILPGLSGLQGLSNLRQNKNTPEQHSSSKNTTSEPHPVTKNTTRPAQRSSCDCTSLDTNTSTKANENRLSNSSEDITWLPKRLQAHRQLSSSDSWGSEDFDLYSSNDEDLSRHDEERSRSSINDEEVPSSKNVEHIDEHLHNKLKCVKSAEEVPVRDETLRKAGAVSGSSESVAGAGGRSERLKARLLRKREQWRERRQSSGRDVGRTAAGRRDAADVDAVPPRDSRLGSTEDVPAGGPEAGKLSRWFSLRKSNHPADADRRTSHAGAGAPGGGRNPPAPPDEVDVVFASPNDVRTAHYRNSSTLSTASSSSSSSSSTTCSSSSLPGNASGAPPPSNARMPRLTELEERMSELDASTNPSNFYANSCGTLGSTLGTMGANTFQRRHQPPSLPSIPTGLTAQQIKRRHIVASIVHSENNYVATLHRLVRDYRKPLEESKPQILSQAKIGTLFHFVYEILQCHTLFRVALCDCVRHWDRDEKIGDVFFACFSKGVVLEIYSEFINNFTRAMELAKLESSRKSVFADFLKMRQVTSPDRLSFFGMMVKPVQRFPQFILFLQDLLKHTPKGHHDRMSLQLALTQLESLAETLNELKRESEQHQAFKATLKQINSKFALRSISEGNRCLIRQDDLTKLEFGPNGLIKQTKERRLFLTTDAVICVSVVPRTSDDVTSHERLSLKWFHPITEVEVQENNSSLTLSRLLAAGLAQRTSGTGNSSLGKTTATGGRSVYDMYGSALTSSLVESEAMVGALCAEMNDLMHDYQVVSRIAGLVATLKGSYDGLSGAVVQGVLDVIQQNIQARDDRMSWLDGCCLQVRAGKETFTFHVKNPGVKKDWIIELRLAQLAVSSVNSPAWDVGDATSQRPPSRRPLFVTAIPILNAAHHTQVVCGCQYPLQDVPKNVPLKSLVAGARRRYGKTLTSVWLCSTDGVTSYVIRFVTHLGGLRECGRSVLSEVCVTAMLHVPPPPSCPPLTPTPPPAAPLPLSLDTVWIGTLQNRLLVYSGSACDSQEELRRTELPAAVSALLYHCQMVYVGLTNGSLQMYQRDPADSCWLLSPAASIALSDDEQAPVKALLPLATQLCAAVDHRVVVIDCVTLTVVKQMSTHHGGAVSLMAHSGIGLWLSEGGSSTVCLYHTESCRHLQDIDVAPSVCRMLAVAVGSCSVVVTALVVSRGLLWVGTSVGVTVTLPLPRLQGVPIISGRPTLSYHAHTGPVTFLMTLMTPEYYNLPTQTEPLPHNEDQVVEEDASQQRTQPRDVGDDPKKLVNPQVLVKRAHTLPRGFGNSSGTGLTPLGELAPSGTEEAAVLGVCGDLLRHWSDEEVVQNHDGGGIVGDLRRSDPSLSCVGSSGSTRRSDPSLSCAGSTSLDRRSRLKAGRPRSLDLSSAYIESKTSVVTTSSMGSDDACAALSNRQSLIRDAVRIDDVIPESQDPDHKTGDPEQDDDLLRIGSQDENSAQVSLSFEGELVLDPEASELNRDSKQNQELSNVNEGENSELDTLDRNAIIDNACVIHKDNVDVALGNDGSVSAEVSHVQLPSTEEMPTDGSRDETTEILTASNDSTHGEANVAQKSYVADEVASSEDILLTEESPDENKRCSEEDTKFCETKNLDENTVTDAPVPEVTEVNFPTAGDSSATLMSTGEEVSSEDQPSETMRRGHCRSSSDVTVASSSSLTSETRPKLSLHSALGPVESSPLKNNKEILKVPPKVSNSDSGEPLSRNLAGTLNRKCAANKTGSGSSGGGPGLDVDQPRTVLVLTGGQGYKCIRDPTPTNGPPHNNTDAHILVWEMKL
ncbi:uncharacterized protein LOC108667398 isoform X2 [Hyalella azteca]|uniref:Uncharacterized protein LOC108667398 isoform X2 n=1 Tax=Hyalella azteca TaxID=294128 RepID=A0A8B7N9G3_HYAAZ|nr:uncharacterized protein LOC108667398 isoform X2 [Hyalella azteca]